MKSEMQRTAWVDVLRFLGILSIYLVHLGESTGTWFRIFEKCDVHLFFFASGLFAFASSTKPSVSFGKYIRIQFMKFMIPYYFFSAFTMCFLYASELLTATELLRALKLTLFAVKDTGVAEQLWFFPALFVVKITFEGIRRLIKNHKMTSIFFILLTLSFALMRKYIQIPPTRSLFCFDYALLFGVYYGIGALMQRQLLHFSFGQFSRRKKLLWGAVGTVCLANFALFFGGKYHIGWFSQRIGLAALGNILDTVDTVLLIGATVTVAMIIAPHCPQLFKRFGVSTLYLCGNENVIKIIVPQALSLFGINTAVYHIIPGVFYSLLLMYLVQRFFMGTQKKCLYFCETVLNQFGTYLGQFLRVHRAGGN